jgi:hypothetical protein
VVVMSAGCQADDSEVRCCNTVDVRASSTRSVTLQTCRPTSSEQLYCGCACIECAKPRRMTHTPA